MVLWGERVFFPKHFIPFTPQKFASDYNFYFIYTSHNSYVFIVTFNIRECPQIKLVLVVAYAIAPINSRPLSTVSDFLSYYVNKTKKKLMLQRNLKEA